MTASRSRTLALDRARSLVARVIFALSFICGSLVLVATSGRPVQAAATSGLPTHLAIGVGASPNDIGPTSWTTSTSIHFDLSISYLSAGVNTGSGWETWKLTGNFHSLCSDSQQSRLHPGVHSLRNQRKQRSLQCLRGNPERSCQSCQRQHHERLLSELHAAHAAAQCRQLRRDSGIRQDGDRSR